MGPLALTDIIQSQPLRGFYWICFCHPHPPDLGLGVFLGGTNGSPDGGAAAADYVIIHLFLRQFFANFAPRQRFGTQRTPSFPSRLTGKAIINISYGLPCLEQDDPYVTVAEKAVAPMFVAVISGNSLVDHLPILKKIPELIPELLNIKAKDWRELALTMLNEPYTDGNLKSSLCVVFPPHYPVWGCLRSYGIDLTGERKLGTVIHRGQFGIAGPQVEGLRKARVHNQVCRRYHVHW